MKTKFWLVCSCLTVMLGCLFIGCKEKAEEQPEYPQDFHFTLVNGSEEYLSDGYIKINFSPARQQKSLSFICETDWVIEREATTSRESSLPGDPLTISTTHNDISIYQRNDGSIFIQGKGSKEMRTINFTITENKKHNARSTAFYFHPAFPPDFIIAAYANLQITQYGKILEKRKISTRYSGECKHFDLEGAFLNYEATSTADWIKINHPYYTITPNHSGLERKAQITLIGKHGEFINSIDTLFITQGGAPIKKEINITTPGTLKDQISLEEKYKITDLTLSGELNDADFRYIREMAGIDYAGQSTEGNLANLNLEEASSNTSYDFSNTNLASVILPASTDYHWGSISFKDCISLTSVELPLKADFGWNAFSGCISLPSINLPEDMTSIERSMFDGCSSLKTINIPHKVASIGYEAFQGCTSLTTIILPASLKSIGNKVFYGCTNLKEIHSLATEPPLCPGELGVESTATLYIPKGTLPQYKDAAIWKNFKNIVEE